LRDHTGDGGGRKNGAERFGWSTSDSDREQSAKSGEGLSAAGVTSRGS